MSAIDVLSTTPTYAWPIPNPDDPDDVPTDLSELAVAVENTVKGGALLPKPAVNGQWIKGVGGLPVWSALTAADVPLVASATPPGSPVDGQEWSLVADATNGIVWTFRYRAASPSAFKWEFVGGSEIYAMVGAGESPAGVGGWTYLPTGPDFVAPRNGEYRLDVSATVGCPTASTAYISVANASVSPTPIGLNTSEFLAGGASASLSVQSKATLNAGQTARFAVYQSAASTSYSGRVLAVSPIRVS